jgi:deoxyribonuclease V
MRVDVPPARPTGEAGALALRDRRRPLAGHRGPGPAAARRVAGLDVAHAGDGHRVGLAAACAHVLAPAPEFRLPETTRQSGRLGGDALAAAAA